MPVWSDLYFIRKPYYSNSCPPLKEGLLVELYFELKKSKHDYSTVIPMFVKIIKIDGNEITAKTTRKSDQIRKNEIIVFNKSLIHSIEADWDYAREYQKVETTKGIMYEGLKISNISYQYWLHSYSLNPWDYRMGIYSNEEPMLDFYDERLIRVNIREILKVAPHIEPFLKTRMSHTRFGDLFLPVATTDQDVDRNEWH